jgi:hypothetical protein
MLVEGAGVCGKETSGSVKFGGISGDEDLLVSKEGLCSIELII